jgi:hypothetical protein
MGIGNETGYAPPLSGRVCKQGTYLVKSEKNMERVESGIEKKGVRGSEIGTLCEIFRQTSEKRRRGYGAEGRYCSCGAKRPSLEARVDCRERAGHEDFFLEARWRFGIKEKRAAV